MLHLRIKINEAEMGSDNKTCLNQFIQMLNCESVIGIKSLSNQKKIILFCIEHSFAYQSREMKTEAKRFFYLTINVKFVNSTDLSFTYQYLDFNCQIQAIS